MPGKKKVKSIPMQSVNVCFTPGQVKALRAKAKKEGISFSELVRRALDAYGK